MKYFKIVAENVSDVDTLCEELELASYTVANVYRLPVFDSMTQLLISTERLITGTAEDIVWDYNCGAFLHTTQLSEEEFYDLVDV